MAGRKPSAAEARPAGQSLREYARGLTGGLLFSLPLLYTMEVWWAGFIARPGPLLAYLAFGLLLLLGYNRFAGLHRDASWLEVAMEAFEEMGLGLALAAAVLWLLGRIDAETSLQEGVGQIVVEGVIAAIGVSVGSSQLGRNEGKQEGGMAGRGGEPVPPFGQGGLAAELVLAACGAVLFAANVASTEEILMVAVEASPWKVLGLVLLSLGLAALVLFYSDFSGSRTLDGAGLVQVLSHSVRHYAVALAVSAFLLWFFGRFAGAAPSVCAAQTVVLGMAGALGAVTGRLLLQ